jgi:hypothetical protein
MKRVRVTIVAVAKQQLMHIEGVSVVLVTQHETCMHRIKLESAACLVLLHLSTLSHKGQEF